MFEWECPKCGVTTTFSSLAALSLAEQAGGCQGCRAKVAFARNPGLIGLFVYFWEKHGYPKSSSWTASVPLSA